MTNVAIVLIGGSTLLVLYALMGYPALLLLGGRRRRSVQDLVEWPMVSITVPAYNEEATIAETVETLLAVDYPADRLQILVVSDGSTDATDRIVAGYADRGVELLRVDLRRGKSAAENQARSHLRGEIIINTDASVRVDPAAVKQLIRHFGDPHVGLASGRDVSVARPGDEANRGEAGYVGYEMWIRDLETRAGGIVGASGCLYAIRREFHDVDVPEHLSRDFMSALTTREHGSRAVSVPGAICYVPRTPSLKREYRRKVRTILRGIQTLIYKRHLLNPGVYGAFAWKLWSHKVCRWAIPWAGVTGLVGVALLVPITTWAALPLVALGIGLAFTAVAWRWPEGRAIPGVISIPAYLLSGAFAVCVGTVRAINGFDASMWEPTRRSAESPSPTPARVPSPRCRA